MDVLDKSSPDYPTIAWTADYLRTLADKEAVATDHLLSKVTKLKELEEKEDADSEDAIDERCGLQSEVGINLARHGEAVLRMLKAEIALRAAEAALRKL